MTQLNAGLIRYASHCRLMRADPLSDCGTVDSWLWLETQPSSAPMTGRPGKPRVRFYRGDGAGLPSPGPGVPRNAGQLLTTRGGTLVFVWMDERVLNWDDASGEPGSDARGNLWAIRSLDGGATWVDRQRLFRGVCGHPPINMIETVNGRIVSNEPVLHAPPGKKCHQGLLFWRWREELARQQHY